MINRKRKRYQGMTIIELVIAVIITMIIVLGVGTVMASGYKSLNRGFKRVELQRDASYAMYVISLPIKEGTGASIEDEGSKLVVDNRDGTQTSFFHDSDSKQFMRQLDENEPGFLIENVENLDFVLDLNRVNISLQIKKADLLLDFSSTMMMRNYGLE